MKKLNLFIITLLVSGLMSCKDDLETDPVIPVTPVTIVTPPTAVDSNYVIVVNEGGFNSSNASISRYNEDSKTLLNNVYASANSTGLGDIGYTISTDGNLAFIVVNNSGKIVKVSLPDLTLQNTISGFTSPREMVCINNQIAYVTDLFSNTISKVSLTSNSITSTIAVQGHTESILYYEDYLYIGVMGRNKILKLDPTTDTFIDSAEVNQSPNSMRFDNNGKLWVMCDGGWQGNDVGGLFKINPNDMSIELEMDFSAGVSPKKLTSNSTNTELYYLNGDIFKVSSSITALPSSAFISSGSSTFYGLAVNPYTGIIYTSDAKDFQQEGEVVVYSASGVELDKVMTGIIPGNFGFYK
tara:strand:+ start:10230 stop:11294 length:1065 start_codon:yes stop_codon:yes gene_type:complete